MQASRWLASADPRVALAAAGALFLLVLYLALRTSATLVAVLLICAGMLGFAAYLARWVMAKDEGTVDMQEVGACAQPPLPVLHCRLSVCCAADGLTRQRAARVRTHNPAACVATPRCT